MALVALGFDRRVENCEEIFPTPRKLVEHNLRHREQRTALKPSTRPSAPQQLLPPPELGQNFPTWALLDPAVQIPGIPKDRRKTLSAWVISWAQCTVSILM
ncbi:hypothetical protein B0H13DRAFT_1853085 [Mycena leptocephala]|nr:hypothetical protein B0H13DRAFT_1853085 [Mycena leptocephala]